MRTRVGLFIATCGGAGYFPIAPGTVGTAVGVGVFLAVRAAGHVGVETAAIVVTLVSGAWAATVAEQALGRKDPGPVVIDEVLGLLVTMLFVPATPVAVLAGFLLFRVFDVIKPYPANRLERVPRGWGVMLDDLMAGVYANLVLQAVLWLAPGWLA